MSNKLIHQRITLPFTNKTRLFNSTFGKWLRGHKYHLGALFACLWKCVFALASVCVPLSSASPGHLGRVCRERWRWLRRYGRLHPHPGPDLVSDRERSTVRPGWTWQWAMINHFVCVRVGAENERVQEPDKWTKSPGYFFILNSWTILNTIHDVLGVETSHFFIRVLNCLKVLLIGFGLLGTQTGCHCKNSTDLLLCITLLRRANSQVKH